MSNLELTYRTINPQDYSMKEADYLLFYDKMTKKLTLKFLSSRLNLNFYSKLSKEVEDFKDSCDKHIYN